MSKAEFDGEKVFLDSLNLRTCCQIRTKAQCTTVGCDKIQAIMTDAFELYLVNSTDDKCEIGPCELFGFNLGAIEHRPAGASVSFKSSHGPSKAAPSPRRTPASCGA